MICVWCLVLVALALHTVDNTSWPKGNYALLKPTTGCPDGWQGKGRLFQDTEDTGPSNNRSEVLNMDGYVSPSYIITSFCVKTTGTRGFNWPKGSYCIYRKRENRSADSLLPGMRSGWLKMFDENVNNEDKAIYIKYSDWIYFSLSPKYSHLLMYFQCKTGGNTKVPIELPITKPFYLLPYGSRDCQQVKWMVATTEWIKYHTRNYVNITVIQKKGTVPYHELGDISNKGITMFYCYYQSCNYTLTEKKGVFQSPGFPLEYPDGQLCSWRIMVPANHTLHVHFTNLSLYENDTKDVLEFHKYYDGTFNLTNTFHGHMEPFTISATTDLLFKFLSNEVNHTLGFRAEYIVFLPAETTLPPPGVSSSPTITAAIPTGSENVPSSKATKTSSNNNTAYALESECKGIGTTVVIVTPLVCLVILIIVIVIVVYRYRHNQNLQPKRETNEERVLDKMAINQIYDQGDILLNHRASTSTVITKMDTDDSQIYQTLSREQNTATMNTTLEEDCNDGQMYQTLTRDQIPEYESPDYSKQNDTTDSNMDPECPEYHELEPISNNVPDVVYDAYEGPNPNDGPLDVETTHNPLYQTATMVTQNHIYDSLA